jgi:HlyD family secretion protein
VPGLFKIEAIAMKQRLLIIIVAIIITTAGLSYWLSRPPQFLVLTGIVTTDEVRVSAQLQGRLHELLVHQGDTVKKGQLLATVQPGEFQADKKYYENSEKESAALVEQAKAELDFLEAQMHAQVGQAQAIVAKDEAMVSQAEADLEYAQVSFGRIKTLQAANTTSKQDYDQARTTYLVAKAHVIALQKEVEAAKAALASAEATSEQIGGRRAAVTAGTERLAAAGARTEKADIFLGYTRIYAPINGIVDVLATLQGEVVNPGQTIVSLIDPDNLWIRADVEESIIDRIHQGGTMTIGLPSGASRSGTVFFRGVDADYATQRDVSRSKRDIKTFQIRLRCDNSDRSLAVGMTAYVNLPMGPRP